MLPFSIRTCAPGDEIALSLVGQASFLEAFAGAVAGQDVLAHCINQHAVAKYAAWLRDPASRVWLAEVEPGRAPVGYLVLTRPDLPLADIGAADIEVKRVYVLHRFQGQRIGARLMEEARTFMPRRRAHIVSCWASIPATRQPSHSTRSSATGRSAGAPSRSAPTSTRTTSSRSRFRACLQIGVPRRGRRSREDRHSIRWVFRAKPSAVTITTSRG